MSARQERINGVIWDLHKERGYVTPSMVVNASRPEDAPLHGCFEWNDTIAGEQWRKQQALGLITSVRISSAGAATEARVFHAVRIAGVGSAHKTIYEINRNPAWRRQVRDRLRSNLMAAERDLELLDEEPARELKGAVHDYLEESHW